MIKALKMKCKRCGQPIGINDIGFYCKECNKKNFKEKKNADLKDVISRVRKNIKIMKGIKYE